MHVAGKFLFKVFILPKIIVFKILFIQGIVGWLDMRVLRRVFGLFISWGTDFQNQG